MIIIREDAKLPEVIRCLQQLIFEVKRLQETIQPNASGWQGVYSNVTIDRGFDATATTLTEVANNHATLVSDLVKTGLLK